MDTSDSHVQFWLYIVGKMNTSEIQVQEGVPLCGAAWGGGHRVTSRVCTVEPPHVGSGFTVLQPVKWLELEKNLKAPPFIGDFQFEISSFEPLLLLTFYFFKFVFTYFWLLWAFAAVRRLFTAAASRVVEHGLEAHRLSCPEACGIFPGWDQTCVPLHWQANS